VYIEMFEDFLGRPFVFGMMAHLKGYTSCVGSVAAVAI
jgi:hypothetical protein